jgi:SagB-type dehydrogenase family enzyme
MATNASRRDPPAWTRIEMIFDPRQREIFKAAGHGLRAAEPGSSIVHLPKQEAEEQLKRRLLERRSERRYGAAPLPLDILGELLGHLRALSIDGKLKYGYGSAGSAYPVQTYLYVKPGRIDQLAAGIWYYHPVDHRLFSIRPDARIEPSAHYFENRSIFESSAFSIFFIGRMDAIAPLYGDKSRDFALIEAGLMTQVLELAATSAGIGLCQIGDLQFARVRDAFLLASNDILLHSLIGGPLAR